MSPFRYTFIQSILILSTGCCGVIAVLSLPTLAILLLVTAGFLSYAVVHYVCYNPNGSVWRIKINQLLASFLLKNFKQLNIDNNTNVQRSELVHKEAQKLIQLILRDFITTWYYQISDNQEFPQEVSRLLEHVALEVQTRLQSADVHKTILSILPLLDPYLTALNEVGSVNERGKLTFDVRHPYCLMLFEKKPHLVHPALKNEQSELEHLQRLADCFISSSAIPSHYKQCDIAVQFVREVLVYRIFQPLFNLLCEPDFLIKAIPLILAKANDEKVKSIMNSIKEENKVLESHLKQPTGLLTPCSITRPSPPPPTLPSLPPPISLIDNFTQSLGPSYPWSTYRRPLRDRSFTSVDGASNTLVGGASNTLMGGAASSTMTEDTSYLEDSVLVNLPPIYISRYVRVQTTNDETHIGYIIRFPSTMVDLPNTEGEPEMESLKRYSEFVRFHKNLTASSLGHLVRGQSLPDRKIVANILTKISFSSGEPDPATILERKEGLERYLNGIVSIKEVRESDLFTDFLASGVSVLHDAHIVTNKPKRGWTAIKDWRKSILPTEKATVEPVQSLPDVLLTFTETYLPIAPQSVTSSLSRQTSLTPPTDTPTLTKNLLLELVPESVLSLFSNDESGDSHVTLAAEREERSPLINSLLSLVNEITRTTSPELWITSEATQLAVLGLCGDTIDQYMNKELYEVITDETRWARALYSLRHLLWPEGVLSVTPSVALSKEERQAYREAAIQEIKNFLPRFLPWLIGSSAYDATIEHCLNCIQNPKINRHFLYRVIDILFLQIVPEFRDKQFQEKLVKLRTRPSFILGDSTNND